MLISSNYIDLCCLYHNIDENSSYQFTESIRLAQNNLINKQAICSILGPIITTYSIKGDYGKALKLIKEYPSQEIYLSWKVPLLAAKGEIYYHLGDTKNATRFLQECLKYCKNIDITDYKNHAISTMALIKGCTKEEKDGIILMENAEKKARNIPLKLRLFQVLQKKLILCLNIDDFTLLESTANQLIQLGEKSRIPIAVGWGNLGLGIIKIVNNDFKNAEIKLLESLQIACKFDIYSLIWRAASSLANIELINHNLIKAEQYYCNASNIIKKIILDLADNKLQKSFLHQPEIRRIIIRGKSELIDKLDIAVISGKENILQAILQNINTGLSHILGKHLSKRDQRQLLIAGIIMEAKALKSTPKTRCLSEFFGVHIRTIERDLKKLGGTLPLL